MKQIDMLRKLIIILIAGMLALMASGCAGDSAKKYRIGVSQCSGGHFRESVNEDIKREQLLHDDVEIEFRCAHDDNGKQIADIRYFEDQGFDLIIVSPNESEALTPVLSDVYRSGIPVITYDRRMDNEDYTAHMEVDNYALGKSVATYASHLKKGKIHAIEIKGPSSASPAVLRHKGFAEAVATNPDIEILASEFGNWDYDRAGALTDSLLKIYPQTDMIYAHTDYMGLGVAEALEKAGRTDIAVLGIDGIPDVGVKGVKEGKLAATFLYPTEGERLLRIAMAILDGTPYQRETIVPPLSPVDSSNVDIFISQEELLASQTSKINFLRESVNKFLDQLTIQRLLLVSAVVIVALLGGLIFLLLRTINSNRRHHAVLEGKNRELEEQKRELQGLYEKLDEATKSKLMFFTNVSHDLKTPLTLISEPVERLLSNRHLPEEKRMALLEIADRNVKILRRLIAQILDFRKFENGKLSLNTIEVDFAALAGEWTGAFSTIALRRHIRLSCDIMPDKDYHLAMDVGKMERVVFNLMSNAFKYTPDNGWIHFSCDCDGDRLIFSVRDTGIGIAPEEITKIFDRFYQVNKVSPNGSGIGLALTKAFIELHGGTIEVSSEKGGGSVFTVTLPVRHTDKVDENVSSGITGKDVEAELGSKEVIPDAGEPDASRSSVLVIDDNEDIRKLVGEILGEEYNVLTASDGRQGLRMAAKYVPDLVICDVMMPVMNGFECCAKIKSELSTSHVPVLMLTACSLDEQRVEGYEAGADGYLQKPFNGAVLSARCRNLIANRRQISDIYKQRLPMGGGAVADVKPAPKSDLESDFYATFLKIVDRELSNQAISVEQIAGEMGLGQSQFSRKIKALTNFTPVELIRAIRLKRARTLLTSTEKTVGEIAVETGFSTQAYFSKCFRDAYGESPTELRGKLR